DERNDLAEIESFADSFKKQRIVYGCTQNDVGLALGKKYGTEFSQTTISRFEALNLSFKNMRKLRPLLKEWMAEVEEALSRGLTVAEILDRAPVERPPPSTKSKKSEGRQRKKRTFIDEYQSIKLAEEYIHDPRPTQKRVMEIAEKLKLEREVVRIWFSNYRQKIRKMEDERLTRIQNDEHK
ncbi:hypothetical protein PFISCL1PPCAC_24258, partial [Pristionchus fissidentatus]